MSSGVAEHPFEVLSNHEVAKGIWRLICQTPAAAELTPGQFVNIKVEGDASHLLRIPLSFSQALPDGTLEIGYAVVGEGTARLSRMRPGASSTLVGPCGKGWRLPKEEGRALLVAGGIGLPPVVAAAGMLAAADRPFDVVVGAQTAERVDEELVERLRRMSLAGLSDCSREVMVCTDDGTRGIKGFTTTVMADLMAERRYGMVYACGPQGMLAGVADLAHRTATPCQVSLERMMGCGFGACSCCNVALKAGGYALCCTDGPVFDAEEVLW